MKVVFKLLLLLALIVYLFMAFTKFNKSDEKAICVGVELEVADSASAGFITNAEITSILKRNKLYPLGKRLDFVDCRAIENCLSKNPFIEKVVCFKSAAKTVNVKVEQRLPVLRIMSSNGEDYYIDGRGRKMARLNYAADLAVVTGDASFKYVRRNLLSLGRYLQEHEFWNDEIEQINVTPNGNLELIPRVGDHVVYLGAPVKLERKLNNLEIFYRKVLTQVGWNKYSKISLEFENQIICTKKS